MCSIKNKWQQYAYSILLLISVLVTSSNQQKPINQPQPFQRYSKAVGDNDEGFQPIAAPLTLKHQAPEALTTRNHQLQLTPSAIAPIDKPIDKRENENRQDRSNQLVADLEDLMWAIVRDDIRNGNGAIQKRSVEPRGITDLLFNQDVISRVKKFTEKYIFQAAGASAFKDILPNSGRLFLFKGKMSNEIHLTNLLIINLFCFFFDVQVSKR